MLLKKLWHRSTYSCLSTYLKYCVLLCSGVSFCLHYCHAPRFYFIVVVNASAKIAGTSGPSEHDRVLGGKCLLSLEFGITRIKAFSFKMTKTPPPPDFRTFCRHCKFMSVSISGLLQSAMTLKGGLLLFWGNYCHKYQINHDQVCF